MNPKKHLLKSKDGVNPKPFWLKDDEKLNDKQLE
jgi:hypothetical protein